MYEYEMKPISNILEVVTYIYKYLGAYLPKYNFYHTRKQPMDMPFLINLFSLYDFSLVMAKVNINTKFRSIGRNNAVFIK